MRRTFAWSVFNFFSTILFCYTVLILSSPHGCTAIDTITINSSLVDGQTLVSAGNRFELGFFGPSSTSNVKRFIGIWYTANPEIVVWVANRTNPLSDGTGILSIANGNLKLLDEKRKLYWSTESTQLGLERKNLPKLVGKLNDNGNFVLFDDDDWTEKIFWQSFDDSTDTYLFGMKMGKNFALTSWTSEKDPAPGKFTFKQDQGGGDQFVVMEKSIPYWRSYRPEFSGQMFISDENKMPGTLINFFNTTKEGTENLYDQRLVMNFTGELQFWQLDADTKTWSLIWRVPKDNCSSFNYCGNFGICNAKNRLPCKCMPGFKPRLSENWNARIFSDGCIRNSTSSCGSMFLNLTMRKVENTDFFYPPENETDCRQECLNNCQCQAYSYFVQRNTKSCFTWTEELRDLQEDQDGGGHKLYVRVAVSDIERTTRNCETCGTNLVPYPLSTGSKCGDALYSSFDCNNLTNQLKFIPSSGSYKVISVYPEKRIFVIQIQSKEAKNCDSLQLSRTGIMQLNRSSKFSMTRCENYRANLVSNDYSQNIGVEVEISWEPPLPPTCNSSADCKDWPYSTCNATENGQRRCLCNSNFQWNGSALNCTPAFPSGGAQSAGEASNGNKSLPLILGLSLAIAMGLLCMVVSIYMWKRKVVKKQTKQRKATLQRYDTERGVKELIESGPFKDKDGTGIDVPFFDFESILAATDNFSEENKLGKGGFGPVYKGKFPGGDEIAVKRLSSVSGQGLEEFKNEVVLIAKLQHRNLVRLLGYCISGEEKILLYEYMPNRSLDSWIFDESISHRLDWETRFNVILGIARGMLYLHQDSRLRIIHRDLKTSNILLDAEMNPKISDFGLARMIQGKETEANTLKVMGTYGYMAPEYALDGLFSIKSDVFSFGVVMIEIISGKKNMRFYQVEHTPSLIGYAWGLWQEGKAMDLMEEPLRCSCNASEFLRCLHVGLLCVQEDPGERPTMSNVVVLLGSETASLPVPNPPAFAMRKTLSSTASTSSKLELDAEISTLQEGR